MYEIPSNFRKASAQLVPLNVPNKVDSECMLICFYTMSSLNCAFETDFGLFQEIEMNVHDFGAFMFFIFGWFYIVLQTIISYKAHPYGSTKRVCHIRAAFSSVISVTVITSIL